MFVVGLALCTFANIASEEMARDLCNEIEKLLGSANSYIRKKAALCAKRIVRKVPDLVDHFRERSLQLLNDKSHGVQLCALSLAIQICEVDPGAVDEYRRATSALVAMLKNLLSTSFSPEHDVAGITDPFLQTKILRFLCILGRGSPDVSEKINDLLAQVATNTEGSKNVGNSILYECVRTILEIEADSGLRVMAINILGKFLGNKDNNIRYVALNTLIRVVSIDTNAVQRHRATSLECLRDADISIRRRALELTYALINADNVTAMVRELLSFLEVADDEFKLSLTTQICIAAERFAPSKRWQVDTMLETFRIAGTFIRDSVLGSFIRLTAHAPELQGYTAQRLYSALRKDLSQTSQTLAAVWVLGEFGETLLEQGAFTDDDGRHDVSAASLIDLLTSLLESVYADAVTREYTLTALAKLSARIHDARQQARIEEVFARYSDAVDVETQKRAVEYQALLRRRDIRTDVLETMPLPEVRQTILGEPKAVARPERAAAKPASAAKPAPHELLADIFAQDAAPAPAARSHSDILGLFDAPAPGADAVSEHAVYDKHGVRVAFSLQRGADDVRLQARFHATAAIAALSFQAAVPKSQKLHMSPISSSSIEAGGEATQSMRVTGAVTGALRLRIRLAFTTAEGEEVKEQIDWAQPT